jgi:hypothetical protein
MAPVPAVETETVAAGKEECPTHAPQPSVQGLTDHRYFGEETFLSKCNVLSEAHTRVTVPCFFTKAAHKGNQPSD